MKAQHPSAHFFLLEPFNAAFALAQRVQDAPGLRGYVQQRLGLIVPIGLLMLFTSLACAAASVMYLGGTTGILVLLAMLLAPFVLVGSLFVQFYTFFAWLEGRALAKALHRKPGMPPVPWLLAAIFLAVPLAMLVLVMTKLGVALIVLLAAAPLAFARLDR
jgi:hypothetical protein